MLGEQCSTPLTKSVSYSHGKKMKNISVKKKKKNIKLKTNLAYDSYSSRFFKKSDSSHLDSINLFEVNDKSILISGSHCLKSLNTELCTKNNIQFPNYERKILNKPKQLNCEKKKKIISPLENDHSNWYNKVVNIICDDELCFPEESYVKEKQKNEEIIPLENITYDNNSKSGIITCYTTETNNVMTKLSEQQDQSLLFSNLNNQSIKRSSSREDDCACDLDLIKSNIIVDTTDVAINKSQLHVKYNDDESKLFDNSLGVSCYQYDNNKVIENAILSYDDCLTTIRTTVDDEFTVNRQNKIKSNDFILSQINQNKISLNHNSICATQNKVEVLSSINSCDLNLDNSNKSFTETLDNKLINVLEHAENNNLNIHSNYNRTSLLLTENINNVSENNRYSYDAKSSIVSNITNKFSDISIEYNRQYDQFIVKDNILEVPDQSLKFVSDKPTLKYDINNSFSTLYNSSNSYHDTVIYNENGADIYLKKVTDSNNVLLNEKNIGAIKTSNNSSNQNIIKNEFYNTGDIIKEEMFQDNYNESEHSFENISSSKNIYDNIFDEKLETSNLSQNISRRKRYANRFQKCFNLDSIEELFDENKVDVQNSTKKCLDYSQSALSHTSGFRLESGKKWRRSIIIVRNFVDQTINLTQNTTTKGRKWVSTVDDVIRRQSISSVYTI